MANEIMEAYKEKGEPGIFKDNEQLKMKTQGGEPMAHERAEKRRQCNPQGPIGYLLETAHIQASC